MPEIVTRVGDLYARAPSLGLSEGQAHFLASLLVRSPFAELRFDEAIVTIARVGEPDVALATPTIPSQMPFEDAGAGYSDGE